MTDPTGTRGYGGPTSRGAAGQSLADQPTTVVPFPEHSSPSRPASHDLWFEDAYDGPVHRLDDDRTRYDEHLADDLAVLDDLDDLDGADDLDDLDGDPGYEDEDAGPHPDRGAAPVAVRRADTLAGLLLVLAGMAAGVSLLVVWVNGGATGLELVADGIGDVRTGAPAGETGWQPLAVVGGGTALFVLGLLMYAPARTHRFLGVLALLVSLVVAAGVLVPLADAGWELAPFAVGASFAVAVGGLGVLGAFKALSTGPRTPRS